MAPRRFGAKNSAEYFWRCTVVFRPQPGGILTPLHGHTATLGNGRSRAFTATLWRLLARSAHVVHEPMHLTHGIRSRSRSRAFTGVHGAIVHENPRPPL